MPPSLTFREYNTRFETALENRGGVHLTRLSNGALVARVGSRGPRLAVIAGLHGDETSGPLAMLEWAVSAPEPLAPPGVCLWLAPLLNDLGWDAGVREWNELDLNRSFLPGRQAPAFMRPMLRDLRRQPPDLLLDLHEDSENPGFVYIFRYTEEDHNLPERMAGALGIGLWDWTEYDEWEGCSELYLRALGCKYCVTLEAPTIWPMAQRIAGNLQAIAWSVEHVREVAYDVEQKAAG